MQHILAANKNCLVQGCKNADVHLRRATKNVECANVFLRFIFHAYECCMASLYVCATKNCCALL